MDGVILHEIAISLLSLSLPTHAYRLEISPRWQWPDLASIRPPHISIVALRLNCIYSRCANCHAHGTLMYPHLQKFMPPVPSRFVQTRESTQAAISDTYNGDGKVYAALRAAAYISWGIVTSLGAPSDTGLRA